jgi:iron complex outermembrane receptor protein
VPGGNPNVSPEDALHVETGINWTRSINVWTYSLDGTIYKTWISDMIVWVPEGNLWSPSNLRKVNAYGAELNAKSSLSSGGYKLKAEAMYSFSRSINKTEEDPLFDNKQLAYVPLHSGRLFVSLNVNRWSFDTRLNLTSTRYTTLDNVQNQSLDPYALMDVAIAKEFVMRKLSLQFRAEAFNVFDIYYENLKNHAMPGRHYAISILLNFNNQ